MTTAIHDSIQATAFKASLSEKDFRRLSEFIHKECGIKMPEVKKVLLEARLRKRLRALGMHSYTEYCDYLFSPEGTRDELIHMIDVVTTNKTDFFREAGHFDYLVQTALPELIRLYGANIRRTYTLWSAGCSTGEEPHTLAMVLSEFAQRQHGFYFSILATDISTKVLEHARRGIYKEEVTEPVPMAMKMKYLLKGKDNNKGLVRVGPQLRSLITFRRLNFMAGDFGMSGPVDIIFCRNVIIYFDRPTQEKLLNRFARHLIPGGYLFMGHSETLNGLAVPLVCAGPMVYRKPL
ncbi:MAG: protein-glutamate O-methyltransferase [Nitrospirae bacterium]|nr:protein-glutamate O-methyltransferase [Nitrospirota bacterium]